MLLLLLCLTASDPASGAEPGDPRSSAAWIVELGGVGGGYAPSLGPLVEATGLGAVRWANGELFATLAYGGDLRIAPGDPTWTEDFHQMAGALGRPNGLFSAAIEAQASAAGATWASALGGARINTGDLGPARAELLLGLEQRQDETQRSAALSVTSQADLHLNPRIRVRGHVEAREFLDAPGLGAASMGLGWSVRPTLLARLDMGIKTSWGAGATGWADQVAPGTTSGWLTLGLDLGLQRGLRTSAELSAWSPLTGTGTPGMVARAALSWRASGSRSVATRPEQTLRLLAPEAREVVVIGSFTGWEPWPMQRQPDGTWSLAVTLPAGINSYMYRVDGVAITPPDAPLFADDDFGLRQGVIVVGLEP